MKALLIEDEPMAMSRMKSLLAEVDPNIDVVGQMDTVSGSIKWLKSNPKPDLILSDIQLADGECFEIFQVFPPHCPVVFITAFNDHAQEAFKANAIDYLLKPLKKEELATAIRKVKMMIETQTLGIDYTKLALAVIAEQSRYNRRYLIRFGDQIRTVNSDDIAYFYTTQKAIFLVTHSGKEYPFDKSLDAIEKELDPAKFFRINRQFIVNVKAIGTMHTASKSRVQLELIPPFKLDEVIVSTERSPQFKEWLGTN